MKHTDSKVKMSSMQVYEDGQKRYTLDLQFTLVDEDFDLALDCVDFLNAHSKEEWAKYGIKEPMDLADFFLDCITHEIHSLIGAMRGTDFVLRMDRKKPSC